MNLFQSEWLREQPRPAAGSYARPAYGARYGRAPTVVESGPEPVPVDLFFPTFPSPAPKPRRRPVASFERAA